MLPLNIDIVDPVWPATAAVAGYLLGSVPFGLVFTRLAGLGDIRAIGSGNTGATNVLRTGNRKLAALTLLCDMLKGLAAVLIFSAQTPVAGLFAFLGHIFPVWLGFRGGKGVATCLGVLTGMAWPCAVVFAIIWLATAFISRYSSLSALVAATAVPVFALVYLPTARFGVIALMSIIIILKHHDNIRRLCRGTESRIGMKDKSR
jgi:glycerol-3-phosphate acyltransferase PlsY